MRARSPSSSRMGSRTSKIEIGLGALNVEYDHFMNECLNLIPKDSDRENNGARSVYLHLADSDTGSDMEQYLNI